MGLCKQSVPDAESLLSYRVAQFLESNEYQKEAEYVTTIARWHEAADGRGLSQLERCRANHLMLRYILDEWMPWHRDTYDFRYKVTFFSYNLLDKYGIILQYLIVDL